MNATLTPGTHVWLNRHGGVAGVVVSEYLPDMYEVRLRSGVVVVPIDEIEVRT